jgi:hypothetical protein
LRALRPSGQSWHRRSSNYTRSLFGSLFFFFNYLPFLERRRKKNSHVWQSQLCVRAYCQPYLTVECVVVPTITTILVCKSRVMVLGLVLWHQIHQLTRQGRVGIPFVFSFPCKAKSISSSWLELKSDKKCTKIWHWFLSKSTKPSQKPKTNRRKKTRMYYFPWPTWFILDSVSFRWSTLWRSWI